MKKVIGIDLGTTNSVVAIKKIKKPEIIRNDEDSSENPKLTRSCVALIDDEFIVGRKAFGLIKNKPESVILSNKRLMGMSVTHENVEKIMSYRDDPFGYYRYEVRKQQGAVSAVCVVLGGREFTPEQISCEILKKIKEISEKSEGEVTHAVITVPAYFSEKQKNATRIAASMAGLKVSRLLAEPTAAAIAYGVDQLKPGEARTVLVYDWGGGTFDLSILNIVDGQYFEVGTSGDRWLGGDDLDQKLQDLIMKKIEKEYNLQSLREIVLGLSEVKRDRFLGQFRIDSEKLKIQLSSFESANMTLIGYLEDENGDLIDIDVIITREEFENLIRPCVQRTIDLIEGLLRKTHYEISMIDQILLVGGTSCIPLVKRMLGEKYGEGKVLLCDEPMLTVAEGAAILAHRLSDEYECPNCGKLVNQEDSHCKHCHANLLAEIRKTGMDVIIYTAKDNYYIELVNEGEDLMIETQTPLPATVSKSYVATANNQRIVYVNIFSKKENQLKETQFLGYFIIDDNLPRGSEIIFDIYFDTNEIFTINAYPKSKPDKRKRIRLTRGGKDAKAFHSITEKINQINTEEYTYKQKETAFSFIEEQIRKIEKVSLDDQTNKIFDEVYVLVDSYEPPTIEDGEDEQITIMFAKIICRDYPSLLGADYHRMIRLIEEAEQTEDRLLSIQATNHLKEILNNYPHLIEMVVLNFSSSMAEEKNNKADSLKLAQYHEHIVKCFMENKFDEARAVYDESLRIRDKYLPPGSGYSTLLGLKQRAD